MKNEQDNTPLISKQLILQKLIMYQPEYLQHVDKRLYHTQRMWKCNICKSRTA